MANEFHKELRPWDAKILLQGGGVIYGGRGEPNSFSLTLRKEIGG